MALEEELEFFEANKIDFLQHYKGQFALIKGKELIGTYTTWSEAFEDGIKKLGNVSFLIKQVLDKEETVQFPALVVGGISAHS